MKENNWKELNWEDVKHYKKEINPVEKELSIKVQNVIQTLKQLTKVQNELNDFMKNKHLCSYSVRGFFKTDNFNNFLDFARYNANYFPVFETLLKEYPNKYRLLIQEHFISAETKQYLTFFMLNTLNNKKAVVKALYDVPFYYPSNYNRKTNKDSIIVYDVYNFLYPIANLLYNDLHDIFFAKGRWSSGRIIVLLYFFLDYLTEEDINIILDKLPTINLSNGNMELFINFIISKLKTEKQKEKARAVLLMREFRS